MLKTDAEVIETVFQHIDAGTTDTGDATWQEPTRNYTSMDRFRAEQKLLRQLPTVYAPSAALTEPGSYYARDVGGTPIIVVRDREGELRGFRNACRHRGMTLIEGEGKTSVFRCTYHGWAYGLDGELQHIPHQAGFPDLDTRDHGLIPVHSVTETGGLIFVCVDKPIDAGALGEMVEVLPEDYAVFQSSDYENDVNWKLQIEGTLEGYHIKPTHEKTFYPYGFDNLNVVETFGRNGRITYPFRRIEELRDLPEAERDIAGKVTYVYNIFPNTTVAVLTDHITVGVSEPLSPGRTRFYSHRLGKIKGGDSERALAKAKRDATFVADTGSAEDNEVIRRIQLGLASEANEFFTYGLYEKAIVHLHRNLAALIE